MLIPVTFSVMVEQLCRKPQAQECQVHQIQIKSMVATAPKLTILVSSINAVGHVNACANALTGLLARGHRIVFVIEAAFKGKLAEKGYEEFIWTTTPPPADVRKPSGPENPGERMAHYFLESKIIGPFSPFEKFENMNRFFDNEDAKEEFKRFNEAVSKAMEQMKPDLIYVDCSLPPAVYYSSVPWIKQISTTPLFFFNHPELPPGGSGLPLNDASEWHLFSGLRHELEFSPKWGDLLENMGYARYPNDEVMPQTHAFTVIAYPNELNYPVISQQANWFNLEVFHRRSLEQKLTPLSSLVPESFLADSLNGRFSGKLIYLSMGSMGSVDLTLMSRLLSTLSTTRHLYIVSKGPRHAEYTLPANMWGERYLPQTAIVPQVDLVITHGGNNTVTETFAEGVPMIVLPLFADQFDNAQRLQETGLGARIDPYTFTESQLLGAIERLLGDGQLREKLATASKRILASQRHAELALKIENMFSTLN